MRGPLFRNALHPLGPVATQAAGQGLAILGQLALLHAAGEQYAPIALALIAVQLGAFVGELGYGRRLMATAAEGGDWAPLYRAAIGNRLRLLCVLAVLLTGGWLLLRGADDPGFPALLAALPALLLSAWDPDPVLHGLGRKRLAGIALAGRWALFAALLLLAGQTAGTPLLLACGAGLALTVSFGTHLAVARIAGLPLAPLSGRGVRIAGAGALWGAALLGTLYWGMLPFLVEYLRPDIAALAILGLQILNSAAALLGRLDRIVLPLLASSTWRRVPHGLLTGIAALPVLALAALLPLAMPEAREMALPLILAEWLFIAGMGFLVPLFVTRARESALLRLHLLFLPAAILAQLAIVAPLPIPLSIPPADPLTALLILRVIAVAAMLLGAGLVLEHPAGKTSWAMLSILPLAALAMALAPAARLPVLAIGAGICLYAIWRNREAEQGS